MRDIKFRGKRIDNGEWVYGYYICYEHMGVIKHIIVTSWAQVYVNSFYVIAETVGQYTGLKDKNGKEIYEGDIVRARTSKKGNLYELINNIWTIEYSDFMTYSGYRFYGLDRRFNIRATHGTITNCCIEVIGNIYENPELLKEESV